MSYPNLTVDGTIIFPSSTVFLTASRKPTKTYKPTLTLIEATTTPAVLPPTESTDLPPTESTVLPPIDTAFAPSDPAVVPPSPVQNPVVPTSVETVLENPSAVAPPPGNLYL